MSDLVEIRDLPALITEEEISQEHDVLTAILLRRVCPFVVFFLSVLAAPRNG